MVFVALAPAARAQPSVQRLGLTEELRIPVKLPGGTRDILVAVGPDGRVVAAPRYARGEVIGFDSAGRALPWKIPTGRGDDAEVMWPSRIGWIAGVSTMWIADAGYEQVALVDAVGTVVKSVERPSWVHPTWAERRKYPVFGSMEAFAVYADESMLIMPSRDRSLLSTPSFDRSRPHLMRASFGGSIQRSIAALPQTRNSLALRAKGCAYTITIPFAARTYWAVSNDGSRVIIVTPGTDSGTVRVVSIAESGDTVFSRLVPQPVTRIAPATIQNFLAGVRSCGTFSAEEIRDSLAGRMPAFAWYVTGVMPGRDRTTWIVMRAASDMSSERTAIVLDDRGETIGAVTLPANETLVGGDRWHAWTIVPGGVRAPSAIVRYRLAPTRAQPPRSARAGGRTSTPRPPA